jgi:hypothetical protein
MFASSGPNAGRLLAPPGHFSKIPEQCLNQVTVVQALLAKLPVAMQIIDIILCHCRKKNK